MAVNSSNSTLESRRLPEPLDAGRIVQLARDTKPASRSQAMNTDYARTLHDILLLMRQREIPFVIVGGIALLQYVPGRNTEGLDIILAEPRLAELPELEVVDRNEMIARATFHGLRVGLLQLDHPLIRRVAQECTAECTYSVGLMPTATIYGLILLKLFALPSLYRQFDLDRAAIYEADLVQLLARSAQADDWFFSRLEEYLSASDLRQLRGVVAEVRQKVRRFQKRDRAE